MIDTLCSDFCCRKVGLGDVGVGLPTSTVLKVTRAHNPLFSAKSPNIYLCGVTTHNTPFNEVYSFMKYSNEASAKTAMSYGCKQVDEFADEVNEITMVFAISRYEWINR